MSSPSQQPCRTGYRCKATRLLRVLCKPFVPGPNPFYGAWLKGSQKVVGLDPLLLDAAPFSFQCRRNAAAKNVHPPTHDEHHPHHVSISPRRLTIEHYRNMPVQCVRLHGHRSTGMVFSVRVMLPRF